MVSIYLNFSLTQKNLVSFNLIFISGRLFVSMKF